MKKTHRLLLLAALFLPIKLYAGAWTLPRGTLWVKSALFIQRTSDRYASANLFCGDRPCRNGERTPYFFNGRVESTASYFDIWYGVTDRLELQFQIPYFHISFEDDVNPDRPSTQDIGDVRFGLRYRTPLRPIVATVRIGAKAPTGFFNKDSEVVPIGDGQWDLELSIELAKSFWPFRAYSNVEVGYRFRFEPDLETTNLVPGDEVFFLFETGYNVTERVVLIAGLSGFWGQEFVAKLQGGAFPLVNSERRILYVQPKVYWQAVANLGFEALVNVSLSGKNYPAGEIFGFGVSYAFNLR